MIGISWGRTQHRRWHASNSHEKAEKSTRWMLVGYPWFMYVAGAPQLLVGPGDRLSPVETGFVALLCVAGAGACVLSGWALPAGLRAYLGEDPGPRLRIALTGLSAVFGVLLLMLTGLEAGGVLHHDSAAGMLFFSLVTPLALTLGLAVSRRRAAGLLAALTLLSAGLLAAAGRPASEVAALGVLMGFAVLVAVFSGRCSAWYIQVMRELDGARDAQARLAVVEERVRFGRDLHDVLGRNLSAIALKSELAVSLAQGGRDPEAAVGQMNEVQQLARESQTEMRAVVRGYREAGLATELAGARSVLRAAGVDCRVEGAEAALGTRNGGEGEGLPGPVQSALGWVVREGATNVLRHADASRCAIRVRVLAGADAEAGARVLLEMENDGAGARRGSGGSGGGTSGGTGGGTGGSTSGGHGIAGLRERLAAHGGILVVEDEAQRGVFRLCAEVPLSTAGVAAAVRNGLAREAAE